MIRRLLDFYTQKTWKFHEKRNSLKRRAMPDSNIYRIEHDYQYSWPKAVHLAKECLLQGGVVAIPTDTLYGLCTLVENVDKLYRLKKRPDAKPLGLFVNDPEDISKYVIQTVPTALLKTLFPGPVTVVFQRSTGVPNELNPGVGTIGLRVPQARFPRDLCRELPYYIIAQTSANISGTDRNPICIEDFQELWGDIDMIVDNGKILENNGSRLGSTVVDLSVPGQFKLLRPGCAELETVQILREFGLETVEEVNKLLKSKKEEETKRIGEGEEKRAIRQ